MLMSLTHIVRKVLYDNIEAVQEETQHTADEYGEREVQEWGKQTWVVGGLNSGGLSAASGLLLDLIVEVLQAVAARNHNDNHNYVHG